MVDFEKEWRDFISSRVGDGWSARNYLPDEEDQGAFARFMYLKALADAEAIIHADNGPGYRHEARLLAAIAELRKNT